MIAIPEIAPSSSASALFFDIYDRATFPKSICVNGFPIARDNLGKWHSHIPYYSKLIRSEDDEEEWSLDFRKAEKKSKAWLVDYPLKTKPGISGGVVIVNDGSDEMVIGIHVAKKSDNAGHGTIFTNGLKSWMEKIYLKWDDSLGEYSAPTSVLQRNGVSSESMVRDGSSSAQAKDVKSWSPAEVAEWLKSINLENYVGEFVSEGITGEFLLTLDDEMLEEMGMGKKLHRHRFKLEREKLVNKEGKSNATSSDSTRKSVHSLKETPAPLPK